jgi:hypothetical protein
MAVESSRSNKLELQVSGIDRLALTAQNPFCPSLQQPPHIRRNFVEARIRE